MYAGSPGWSADWISEDDLAAILQTLSGRIQPAPGGEPFLNFELLCRALRMARYLRIPSLFVETNCYWARSDRETREKLWELKDCGLAGILISINPFYLEHIPFQRSERAIRAAREVFGPNVVVYQEEYLRLFRQMQVRDRLPIHEFLKLREGRFFSAPCTPAFLRSWHNHFDNYGNFMPGYCGGLSLGDCRQLDSLLGEGIDLDARPVLSYIIADNFEGLLAFAVQRGYRERPSGYLSKCHLCADIRKFLVRVDDFAELEPREFYDQLEAG